MPKTKKPDKRKPKTTDVLPVLIECGFRCAVPTCRGILALDIHHIVEVNEGGGSDPSNLLALCPTDHALYTRGEIPKAAIYAWKSLIVSLTKAFDHDALDTLLFLEKAESAPCRGRYPGLIVTSDGLLKFSRLIAASLVDMLYLGTSAGNHHFQIALSETGKQILTAWKTGNPDLIRVALSKRGTECGRETSQSQ